MLSRSPLAGFILPGYPDILASITAVPVFRMAIYKKIKCIAVRRNDGGSLVVVRVYMLTHIQKLITFREYLTSRRVHNGHRKNENYEDFHSVHGGRFKQ
jgi:hypothetical protein